MKRISTWILASVVLVGLVAGCTPSSGGGETEAAITVEEQDNGLSLLTLSERAAQRLDVQTAEVVDQGSRKVIPYAAVIYDAQGATWAYAASSGLTFQRAPIIVETILDDQAFLTDGPPAGTQVVTVGAAELYGAETGVGGGH